MDARTYNWKNQGMAASRPGTFYNSPQAKAMANSGGGGGGGSDYIYNRKAFAWGGRPGAEPAAQPAPQVSRQQAECANRVYEVVATTGVVRAEPHAQAKLKGKKSRGGRIICSEITVNGWLKLASEPGWLLSHMQGVDGVGEVALPVDDSLHGQAGPVDLAVPEYQPQGMCCLEVLAKSGVPVRESPSKEARALGTRKQGEYVFAQLQNFDGWVRLAGEEGWMLANHKEWGPLLRPRSTRGADAWALCDAWGTARRRPGKDGGLSPRDVQDLKELERRMLLATSSLWDQHATESKMQELVETGLLTQEDLSRSEHWVFQRLFAGVLKQSADEGEAWVKDLIAGLELSPRVPPLWGAEDELQQEEDTEERWEEGWQGEGGVAGGSGMEPGYDPDDPAFEGTTPVEFNGKTYIMAPNNVIFDPPNQTPIGIWNSDTNRIDPAAGMVPGCPYAALSYFGRTYLLMPDGKLLDPETQKVVGSFDRESNTMDLDDDPQRAGGGPGGPGGGPGGQPGRDPVLDDDEPVDPQEFLERGHQMAKAGRFPAAVTLYGEALKGYSRQRAVDMEFECEALRARAACHLQLGNYRELKEDAERVLGCFPGDREAQEWKRKASEGIRRAKFGLDDSPGARDDDLSYGRSAGSSSALREAQKKAPCSHCNGMATKCVKCGAGMERCAYCASPVSRANCCSKCHCTYYCGRECQRAHWKTHKLECRSSEE